MAAGAAAAVCLAGPGAGETAGVAPEQHGTGEREIEREEAKHEQPKRHSRGDKRRKHVLEPATRIQPAISR